LQDAEQEGVAAVTEPTRIVADEVRVRINSDVDIVAARYKGRELARELGFGPTDLALITTAISELARNIVLYAPGGEIILKPTDENEAPGIVVVASDEGSGISDIAQAMQDGYSTSGGLGLGLGGVRRLMDEFEIVSRSGLGTTVTAKKWNW
jgi:serine/threonine-protein kinase RsbT